LLQQPSAASAYATILDFNDDASGGPAYYEGAVGAVPEPSTWAIMLVGLGGLGAAMRRRRRAASTA
jgi:hypothetical protein